MAKNQKSRLAQLLLVADLAQEVTDLFWQGCCHSNDDEKNDKFYNAIVHLGNALVRYGYTTPEREQSDERQE